MTMFAHSFASFTLSSNCWSAVSQVSVALTLSGWSVGRHWKKPTFADLRRPAPTCADLRRLAPTCADLRRLSPTFADLRRPRKIFFWTTHQNCYALCVQKRRFLSTLMKKIILSLFFHQNGTVNVGLTMGLDWKFFVELAFCSIFASFMIIF